MTSSVVVRLQRRIDTLEAEKVHLQRQVTDLKAELEATYSDLRKAGGPRVSDMQMQAHNVFRLTPHELRLLFVLLSRPEGVSKNAIMDCLYDHGYSSGEVPEIKIVDVYICKIRKKLRFAKLSGATIETVWGKGYRILPGPNRDRLMETMGLSEETLTS